MEGFLILVIVIGFIILNKNINSKFNSLESKINSLQRHIKSLQEKITSQKYTTVEKLVEKETEVIKEPIAKKPIIDPVIVKEAPVIIAEKVVSATIQPIKKDIPPYSATKEKQQKQQQKTYTPKKPWFETFKEKNPDLEKFIGENLINKVGILILVLGISFFVKYAIDKDWINEPARVGVGILSGALVMMIAHKLKKNYASFSSVLVAGAISIFYFTIYIAFHEYQLFSQTIAFIIMAVITAFSALVSISYNRQELAVLSLIGGFAAPFMLATGEGNYVVLFSYIVILNIGILAISYFKKWKIATILDFVFTLLLFGVWCLLEIGTTGFSHQGALIFATLFYFIFSITIVLSNLRNKGVFSIIEYFILVANTFFFFGIGMAILSDLGSSFTGLFTLMLGVYNILYAGILYKKFGLDKNAVYLLIGLALTFATLTIPIQFEGNQITIFWAAEVVLLLWLSQKSKISYFKLGAIIVQVLTLFSLLMDWVKYVYFEDLSVVFNSVFISGFVVCISLFITYWFLKKEKEVATKFITLKRIYKPIVLVVAISVTYFTGILEVIYQSNQFLANSYSALSFPVSYHYVFILVLLLLSSLLKKETLTKAVLVASVLSIFLYIVLFYKLPTKELVENFVINTTTKYAFYFHYIILGCLVFFGYKLFQKTNTLFNIKPKKSKWLPWVFVFAIVYVLSNEIMVHGLQFSNSIDTSELLENSGISTYSYVTNNINYKKTQIIKIGYPILWGVFSFIFLIIGIRKQWKVLRIIALSLLGLTIVKLFAYDIKDVSETGKIIAFILLGVLILVISFVYQKIKKLVVDETTENEITN